MTTTQATSAAPVRAAFLEFLMFGVKQAWACLFGGLMLALILATHLLYPPDARLPRYDFLLLAALAIQALLIALHLETREEAIVIFLFHLVGTAMEIFKTEMGSWSYPEESFIRIAGVPLFSGFMYSAVGSYLARVSRIFEFRFTRYPPLWATWALCAAIYLNFFTHHFTWDARWLLFAATLALYGRTWVSYRPHALRLRMPLVVGFTLVALFIWFAENLGTFGGAWVYPDQAGGWRPVPIAKMGSWLLLMIISFVLVTLVRRPRPEDA
jgi:uncharacterized membrane protein YoaT (DUF817 family)